MTVCGPALAGRERQVGYGSNSAPSTQRTCNKKILREINSDILLPVRKTKKIAKFDGLEPWCCKEGKLWLLKRAWNLLGPLRNRSMLCWIHLHTASDLGYYPRLANDANHYNPQELTILVALSSKGIGLKTSRETWPMSPHTHFTPKGWKKKMKLAGSSEVCAKLSQAIKRTLMFCIVTAYVWLFLLLFDSAWALKI